MPDLGREPTWSPAPEVPSRHVVTVPLPSGEVASFLSDVIFKI